VAQPPTSDLLGGFNDLVKSAPYFLGMGMGGTHAPHQMGHPLRI